ncbi:Snf7-domain-containing protein [Chaetomidium leptoderma]|uniref:Snf7-domain-containing protein n=1 Tax=Chaetomidium leptoderma TaxID=669021 RepID=A0AAN6VN06_9PEZI|nr:Snf7-domain-containing protein [Chaetomidium leptoderma]
METLKNMFAKPDPQAQFRKCNSLLRANMRKLDRDIAQIKAAETKTKNLIIAANKRAQRSSSGGGGDRQKQQAQREVRDFARELLRTRKAGSRLVTGRAQLASVQMQVSEAFALRRIEGSIRASVGIMKDVNSLIRLPEFAHTMQELSVELMKAGVIEDMVGDMLPVDGDMEMEGEEEEEGLAEGEVDKVLGEILKDRMETAGPLPSVPLPQQQQQPQKQPQKQQQQVEEEEEEEDTEAMMDQMRNRLEALRS